MKMAESEKIVLVSCIVDFGDIQVWLRRFTLNLNACKVMNPYDGLLQNLAWKYQERHHNFAGIEIQAKLSESKLYIVEINNVAY